MSDRSRPLRHFVAVAAVVAMVDLLTKLWATTSLPTAGIAIAGPVDLALTYNLGSAFGATFRTVPWQLNALATLAALVLAGVAVSALSRIDRRAPTALGLIGGASLGNLASLIAPPAGVADFIAVQLGGGSGIVMNLADVAAYAGVVMIVRSAILLSRAIIAQREVRPSIAGEVEITIPIAVENLVRIPTARARTEREHPNGLSMHTATDPLGDSALDGMVR